ncbi:hypothetical protein SLEP1_g19830 [Rubroshorea leprosula]|nr:hypothetical protein SLEP1_g19830 [Rubroshorea leprosula]
MGDILHSSGSNRNQELVGTTAGRKACKVSQVEHGVLHLVGAENPEVTVYRRTTSLENAHAKTEILFFPFTRELSQLSQWFVCYTVSSSCLSHFSDFYSGSEANYMKKVQN